MTITQLIAAGRRAMIDLELRVVEPVLDQYGVAWRHIVARLDEVEGMIEAAIARGEVVDDAWLRQQRWWQTTLDSIEAEMSRFTVAMGEQVAAGQTTSLAVSRNVSMRVADFIAQEAANRGIGVTPGIQGRINPIAFERWVIANQPGSPVREAIDRYGTRVSESVRTRMTEGLAAGEHPRTITRQIVADVGPEAVEGRIHTITRTETLRAYRGSLRESIEGFGPDVVSGWRWIAALGRRTCAACLAMHNRVFPYDQYPDRFHVACRCSIAPVVHNAIVPQPPIGRSGDAWLRDQPLETQRAILKSDARLAAFRNGEPLDTFVGVKSDPVWGESIVVKPVREAA